MHFRLLPVILLLLIAPVVNAQQNQLRLQIDGSKKLQTIDGIGVNANTRSWNGDELKPAIDMLLDSMNMKIWRVIVETVDAWEVTNDNNDPFTFNWNYYDSLYETPKFQKAWAMMSYLNQHGVTDKLMINFMGFAPSWMGNKVIETKYEDEYVEMILSFFIYALDVKKIKFGLIAPTNESDHHQFSEGPHLTGEQHTRMLHKLIDRMDKEGVRRDIKLVAPDNANMNKSFDEFLPAMFKDSVVMSRIAHLGFHSYGGNGEKIKPYISASNYPNRSSWITEWNAWCNGCDDGILGDYSYQFGQKSVDFLLKLLGSGAQSCLLWEGYDSYYSHHAPSKFSYWGVLGYDSINHKYIPRKHYYTIQQVSRFVNPGSELVSLNKNTDSMQVLAFLDTVKQRLVITGINSSPSTLHLAGILKNFRTARHADMYYTNENENLVSAVASISGNTLSASIPANCIFTVVVKLEGYAHARPEPQNWYAGDIHVHRNCGDEIVHSEHDVMEMMETNDLAVMSLLADMGNGEVKDSKTDLRKVTGKDIRVGNNRIMRWDTEWHWDATYSQFSNQALGGHLVLLGLNNAKQIWEESPYKILDWAKQQNAVRGFAHFQYLNDKVQKELNCCIPVDYPVEAALKTIDFVSEDVFSTNMQGDFFNSEAVTGAYYKLLNCGFRPGFAAGTDYPCNGNEPPGSMLTYAKVDGKLSYRKWIDAIKHGKTVVSRNGHKEFIDVSVNSAGIGDELKLKSPTTVDIKVKWTGLAPFSGNVEIVHNGQVIAFQPAHAEASSPYILNIKKKITRSGWICARRMAANGHQVHTAPVYVTVNNQPVRASAEDAMFFVSWIDNILENIAAGKPWSRYFTKDRDQVIARYKKARTIYQKIADESDHAPVLVLYSKKDFGEYTNELLKAEGIHSFSARQVTQDTISLSSLKRRKVVVLAATDLTAQQVEALTSFVKNGGKLISTIPKRALQSMSGVNIDHETNSKYVIVDDGSPINKNFTSQRMRIHSKTNACTPGTAKTLAYFDDRQPAIVQNNFGKGEVISFLYNLPENIVLTRQGNPADAGKEMDSIPGLRAMDLFTNGWVDTANNVMNHADEQMRILSRSIDYLCRSEMPVPRVWYFPDTLSCVVTLNNDGEDSKESEFEPQFHDVYAKGAKMTLYVKEVDLVSKQWTDKWRARGFEISGHPDQTKFATDPGYQRMDTIYKVLNAKLNRNLDVPSMKTVTNHWFVWPGIYADGKRDFAAQAKLEASNGVGLDCNYAHYDNNAREKKFLGAYGYTQGNYTGSGLPMKFADVDGNVIDIYQQLNNVYDQQYMEHKDQDGYFNAFKGIMDRSINNGVYSYISVRAHNNEYFFSKVPLMKMLDYANEKRVPVWNELMLLDFLRAKEAVAFDNIRYTGNTLSFGVHSPVACENNVSCMVAASFDGRNITRISVDEKNVAPLYREVKGIKYAFIPVKTGVSHSIEIAYK